MTRRDTAAVLVALALLGACAPSQPEFVRTPGAPTYPATDYVELLDAPPSRAYKEIGTIDVAGETGALRAQVLTQIRAKAQQIGADAVILRDVSRVSSAQPRLNPTTGTYELSGGQTIPAFKGIAIKYQ